MKKHVKMHLCIYRLLPNRLHPRPHRRKIVKMPRLKQEAQCKRGRFCNAEALQIRLSTKTQVAPRRPPPTLLMQLLLESRKLRLAFFPFVLFIWFITFQPPILNSESMISFLWIYFLLLCEVEIVTKILKFRIQDWWLTSYEAVYLKRAEKYFLSCT